MEIDDRGVVTTHVGKEQMYGSPIVKEMLGYETEPVVVRKFKRREARRWHPTLSLDLSKNNCERIF